MSTRQSSIARLALAALCLLLSVSRSLAQGITLNDFYDFGDSSVANPYASLTLASDGNYYTVTEAGGANGTGAVVRLAASGVATIVYSFSGLSASGTNSDGAIPMGTLVQWTDGNLWGTCSSGGASGLGTVFKISLAGAFSTVHSFQGGKEGASPEAGLTIGADGLLYGTTVYGGSSGLGTIYYVPAAGNSITTIYSLFGDAYPIAGLTAAPGGTPSQPRFYAVTSGGGQNGHGAILFLAVVSNPFIGTFVIGNPVYSFSGIDGSAPYGNLTLGSDGSIYGTTFGGGIFGFGTVFSLNPNGNLNWSVPFDYTGGANPIGGLALGPDGNLYGTTAYSGLPDGGIVVPGGGTVFRVTPTGKLTTEHEFGQVRYGYYNADGAVPAANLITGANGNLYGLTLFGGNGGLGAIFQMAPDGVFTSLGAFNMAEFPNGTPMVAPGDGYLYGTAFATDVAGDTAGVIYRLPLMGGGLEILYNSGATTDLSYQPIDIVWAPPTLTSPGLFFVTTQNGIATMAPDGSQFTPIHVLTQSEGLYPTNLVVATDGFLYAACLAGGDANLGTIIRISKSGAVTRLYSFPGSYLAHPVGLIQASDGYLYGATTGSNAPGVIYRIPFGGVPSTPATLYTFTGGNANPFSGLTEGVNPDGTPTGILYGTTGGSSAGNYGSVYQYTPSTNTFLSLYTFQGSVDGGQPANPPTQGYDGYLYGTTTSYGAFGDANGGGTLYQLMPGSPQNTVNTFFSFPGSVSGASYLVETPDGTLYGSNADMGAYQEGWIYSFTTVPSNFPHITALSPSEAPANIQAISITVTGVRFNSGSVVQWNSSPLQTTFVSSTQLTAIVPASLLTTPGPAQVVVANGGIASNPATFTVLPALPYIQGVTPPSYTLGDPTPVSITVNGNSFQNGATVTFDTRFGDPQDVPTTYVSSTQLTASIPASMLTSPNSVALVGVVNPDGGTADPAPFFIDTPPPALTGLTPSSAVAGGPAFNLTLTGTSFYAGDTVYWNSVSLDTTVSSVSTTRLTAYVPAALISNPGTASIMVADANGNVSNALSFAVTNAVPGMTSIKPSSKTHGSPGFTLTVIGKNYQTNSVINWTSGTTVIPLTTIYISPTTLKASVKASLIATAGTAKVSVTNPAPGGGTSSVKKFTIK